jgi:2-polyprenyl-3-methyl-5-hydroxy-6-metoxy-1,4-benzoquinol methylase
LLPLVSTDSMTKNLKQTESETLATFKKHRPSEYFSHLESADAFTTHETRVERLYRFGLTLPPEFFAGKTLIDLGCGTGEHTVSLARWGAVCTLVEMNEEAVAVARRVFAQHTANPGAHQFINASLYDIDVEGLRERFDISHSRGVFTHVADKARAFRILASLAKPGGYVIFGDRNTSGGVQEMLQRLAIYHLGGTDDARIIDIAEALFSEDIDRSVRAVPRTREAVIFDRWVIQQQDDPSVEEVLGMFEAEGLEYVSSWPRIDFMGRGVATHTDVTGMATLKSGARLVENLWMMLNRGEDENIALTLPEGGDSYLSAAAQVAGRLRNLQIGTQPDLGRVQGDFEELAKAGREVWSRPVVLGRRLSTFLDEVQVFLKLLADGESPERIRAHIDRFDILFKGFAGVRHVDYVAYKHRQG